MVLPETVLTHLGEEHWERFGWVYENMMVVHGRDEWGRQQERSTNMLADPAMSVATGHAYPAPAAMIAKMATL